MLLLCMLHFIMELAFALRRGNLYLLNHGNFVQYNTILNYKKNFTFFHSVTLGAVTFVTKFLENHSPRKITNNLTFTLIFQIKFYTIFLLHCLILVCTKLWTQTVKCKVAVSFFECMLHHFCGQRENGNNFFQSQNFFKIQIFKTFLMGFN